MGTTPLVSFSLALLAIGAGCAASLPRALDKSTLWLSNEPLELVAKLGYTNANRPSVARDSHGESLFIQFDDAAGVNRLLAVSSNDIRVAELSAPKYCWLNDKGDPIYWYDRQIKAWRFASGTLLPTNYAVLDADVLCDGKFVPIVEKSTGEKWVARIESPLQPLLSFPRKSRLELLAAHENRLHLFVRMQPDDRPVKDREDILRYLQYQIAGDTGRLLHSQQFDWTQTIFDFCPENNLLLVRSMQTYSAHGWLIDLRTGARERLGLARQNGLFLKKTVIRRFHEAMKSAKSQ